MPSKLVRGWMRIFVSLFFLGLSAYIVLNPTLFPGQDGEGRARGGFARAAKLSPEQRSAIASEAAKQRWAGRDTSGLPKALPGYTGVLNLGGIRLPCAVIEGPKGVQRVLSENGITNAILGSRSGASKRLKKAASDEGALLPIFLAPSQLKPFITEELIDGPLAPIDYVESGRVVRGYDASILPAVCDVWLKARESGALQYVKRQDGEWFSLRARGDRLSCCDCGLIPRRS